MTEKNQELRKKMHKKEQLTSQISELELELKKLQHDIKKLEENHALQISKEKEYSKKTKDQNALKEAESLSDQQGRELERRIKHSEERRNALSRIVNPKAQTMYDQHEKCFTSIQQKIRLIEKDRRQIERTIELMDEKKRNTLIRAHQQVTKDFGSIFGTLLPGANAELRSFPGKTVLDGLEVSRG